MLTVHSRFGMTAALVIVFAFSFAACGIDTSGRDFASEADERLDSSEARSGYLSATVEPCSPVHGSDLDPCERRFDNWDLVRSPYRSGSGRPEPDTPTIEASLALWFDGDHADVPHIIVRGTPFPNTTRCVEQDVTIFGGIGIGHEPYTIPQVSDKCFVDLRVNEYIVGRGPSVLTILVGGHHKILDYQGNEYYEWLEGIHSIFEGREWIIGLTVPIEFSYSTWQINYFPWDLQRRNDGTLVVVDWLARMMPELPRNQNGFEATLDEFRKIAKRVHATHSESTGGRTGAFEGAPLIIADANVEFIHALISHAPVFNIIDATPESPPPVPGDGDRYTPGQNISDETVTASPEVPGGLEGTPTPVSALGDEPTATVEPTATATVEPTATESAEPTVTPEPAPTPDLEDTPTPEPDVAPTATPEPVPTPEPEPTATPEPVVEPTATPEPAPVVEPTATATPEPEPAVEPTATPEDAVATDTPEPEVPGPEGPGAVDGPGDEDGPDGPDTGSGPDG